MAAKAGHKAAAVADISFFACWAESGAPRRRISTESRGWHFCCPRPPAHEALRELAQVISYETYAFPPQPLPAPTARPLPPPCLPPRKKAGPVGTS